MTRRWISRIVTWWQRRHSPLAAIPGWRAAREAELRALRRGCTQALHRARMDKRAAVNAALAQINAEDPEQGRRIAESW